MADPSLPTLLSAALRRFVVLFVVVAAGTLIVSAVIGTLAGAALSRSVSVGFYAVGSFLLIFGFFAGNRGPVRVKGDPGFGMFGVFRDRRLRWASGSEQSESLNLSLVFVALGVLLIVVGVITDTRYSLV